ncbi:MAG: GIY-YIG nuclease family protein [Chitinophagaceae bacterium]|nr:GIY-YIG nuclease family protein [Chitinophagaceae bacterium]
MGTFRGGWVYIMSNQHNTTLYVGVTSCLSARVQQHKKKFFQTSFSAKYNCDKLVYYAFFNTIIEAIAEEKRLKAGSRNKKERLIESMNPFWVDLCDSIRLL